MSYNPDDQYCQDCMRDRDYCVDCFDNEKYVPPDKEEVFLPDSGGYYRPFPQELLRIQCDGEKWTILETLPLFKTIWQKEEYPCQ